MKRHLITILLVVSGSCVGTEIGNPPSALVGVEFVSVESALRSALVLENGVDLQVAQVSVGGLSFTTCEDEEGENFVSAPFKAELVQVGPELPVSVPLGEYCQVDLELRQGTDAVPADSPELVGLTVYAEGTFENTPLEIRYDSETPISFRGEFEIESRTSTLFIPVELNAWFDGMDLSTATQREGRIVISSTENPNLFESFDRNFRQSISVASDDDDDGELDIDELD